MEFGRAVLQKNHYWLSRCEHRFHQLILIAQQVKAVAIAFHDSRPTPRAKSVRSRPAPE